MAEIFISYKSERRAAAEHFAEVLRRHGFTVWFDYELVKGKDFAAQIERQIREAKALVALWCSLSVTSRWVREEVHLAHDLGILVPVKIEPCEIPFGFRLADTIDLTAWDGAPRGAALDPLIDALEGRIKRDAVPDRKALIEYEGTWRRFGGRPLKDFMLGKALEPAGAEPVRFGLAPAPHPASPPPPPASGAAPALTAAERDWERFGIAGSEDVDEIEAYIKQYAGSEPVWAVKAKKRLAAVHAMVKERAETERQRQAVEAEERRQEEDAQRVRVTAAYAHPKWLERFLPGAGKAEWFKDADFSPEMVIVPAGEFWMGSKDGEGDAYERPRHKVTIPKPFAVGRHAVTFDEWDSYVADGGSGFLGFGKRHTPSDRGWGRGRRPVRDVNWDDAQAYIKWLSSKTAQPYRLLSETEWEYCCRAGTETPYSFGGGESDLDRYAWYSANSGGKTHPVGEKLANEWGLHDMHGNVWEWCQDCWNDNYKGAPQDGSAWTTGDSSYRVLRGGSWNYNPQLLRAACRRNSTPGIRSGDWGFRVALGWQDLNR